MALAPAAMLGACTVAPSARPPALHIPLPGYSTTGLERVVGQNAQALEGLFGKPDLDVHEASARKLQYSSAICVLDAYLYPPKAKSEPIVTHVDARQPDGRDIDRASCVAALVRRQGGK